MKGFVLLLCVLFAACPAFAAKQYSYFRAGNPNDISATTTPGTVLMGAAPMSTPRSSGCANAAAAEIFS